MTAERKVVFAPSTGECDGARSPDAEDG